MVFIELDLESVVDQNQEVDPEVILNQDPQESLIQGAVVDHVAGTL